MRKFVLVCLVAMLVLTLLPSVGAQEEETFPVTILHTNDTHAHHEPDGDGNGGIARQATVMNQIAAEGGNVILLDGGDRFSGTLYHTQYQGQDQVQVMNLLGYDAMALGNHEFDNGDEVLAAFLDGVEFPVVSANVDVSASPVLSGKVLPYAILDVADTQIGVIGLTTYETPDLSSPGAELVWSEDYVGIVNELAAELSAQGINKIVLLTHTGISSDLAIIEQLENIDVFIGGHSHTLLSNQNQADYDFPLEFTSPLDQPILYAQAGSNNTYLGRLDVEFDAEGVIADFGGDTIFLSSYIAPDAEAQALLDELSGPVTELQNTPINATTDVELIGDRNFCRIEECALGNIIADALLWETGAQIAIVNAGGIRANIPAGDITLGGVLTVHPFGNQVATMDLTGAELVTALENGVSRLVVEGDVISRAELSGRFPQVAGIRYSIDATAEAGSRIVSVEIQGEDGSFAPIDPAAVYSVATNNFVRQGGDGYEVFVTAANAYDFGRIDYEVLSEYLQSISPITEEAAAVQGRITYTTVQPAPVE